MDENLKKYIDERFDRLEAAVLLAAKPLLTTEEAAAFTGYTVGSIRVLAHRRRIPHFKKEGKLVFRRSELEAWMTETRIMTEDELNRRATTYVATH